MWTRVLLILRKNQRINVSGVVRESARQPGQKGIMFLATMDMIAQDLIHAKTVNVTGSVLHAIMIVNRAMAAAVVCTLGTDM